MRSLYAILAICFLGISTISLAQTEEKNINGNEVEKIITNSYNVGKAGSLSISNSFGDINIESFSGSKIEVEVTVTVEAKKLDDTWKYLDKIKIDVSESGNEVRLKTINEINGGNKIREFSIDYDVKVPEGTSLKIRNTFGDLYIQGTGGELDINVQHGDARIGKATLASEHIQELSVQFGDLRVEEVHNANVRVQHGDFIIERLHGGEVDLGFGDGRIEHLSGEVRLDVSHSELEVEHIDDALERMDGTFQFSEFSLTGVGNGDFEIDAEGSFTDFDMRGNFDVVEREEGINSESYRLFTGDKESAKKIRLRGSHSDLNID